MHKKCSLYRNTVGAMSNNYRTKMDDQLISKFLQLIFLKSALGRRPIWLKCLYPR